MIKINLLGESTAIDYSKYYLLAGYVASLAVGIIVCFILYSITSSYNSDLKDKVAVLEKEYKTLQEKTKEVRALEAKRKGLRDKLTVIATLKRNKVGPVRVMDDLNLAIPNESWITKMEEKSRVLRIEGMALNNQTIADFMRELERSDYFTRVDLVETKESKWKGKDVNEFILRLSVNYLGKIVAKKAEKPKSDVPEVSQPISQQKQLES